MRRMGPPMRCTLGFVERTRPLKTIELHDNPGPLDVDEIARVWPRVTYRGEDIIDLISRADRALALHIEDEVQGVYLGWIPGECSFVMGWDAWDEEGMYGVWCRFFVSPDGSITRLAQFHLVPRGFYHNGAEDVAANCPGIVDLRLD